ncbi:MAG: hypothetical protein COT85_08020 [Chlamydiae bacterium CG10_big_fil_rev_8_21_14_0_10_42_34]|nr:MAG: hypothetical protein COT85_08020 [Chlamydiae bacterium CG10_big_fil_rev_8_21_14_0_10_42_34]
MTQTNQPIISQSTPSVQGAQSGGFERSGTYGLWQMMLEIMKYEKTVLDNNAKLQQGWAQTLGGKNGVYSKLYDIGVSVGDAQAEGLRDSAYSQFAQAGLTGLSLGASAVKYFGGVKPQINEAEAGLADNAAMKGALTGSNAGVSVKGQNNGVVDSEVTNRVNGWADHSLDIENFNGDQADLNKLAAKHAANDPEKYGKIMERVEKRSEGLQNQISNADTKYNTWVQVYNGTLTQGLQRVAEGYGTIKQADAKEAEAKASASNTIVSQVQQQITAQENRSQQNAADALQQANQWASAFAQAAASQVHG